jgi:hypothetical protein
MDSWCRLQVVMRVRPLPDGETDEVVSVLRRPGEADAVAVFDRGSQRVWDVSSVVGADQGQRELADAVGLEDVARAALLDGSSGCLMCHGATGSGKTFSMFGRVREDARLHRQAGMVPRLLHALFREAGSTDEVTLSFLEVYNENVYDLVAGDGEPLLVRESVASGSFYAEGARWEGVHSLPEAMRLIASALEARAVSSHAMNRDSSRSHAILSVLVSRRLSASSVQRAVILLVDLAGSEKLKQTGTTGEGAVESAAINKSLLTLSRCVTMLGTSSSAHVPFRNSVLTRLLKSVLTGTSGIKLVACVSPSVDQVEHSLATLQYAARAAMIRSRIIPTDTDPSSSSSSLRAELAEARAEIERLREENRHLRSLLRSEQTIPTSPVVSSPSSREPAGFVQSSNHKPRTSSSTRREPPASPAVANGIVRGAHSKAATPSTVPRSPKRGFLPIPKAATPSTVSRSPKRGFLPAPAERVSTTHSSNSARARDQETLSRLVTDEVDALMAEYEAAVRRPRGSRKPQ